MCSLPPVKTIEAIRLGNFWRLAEELASEAAPEPNDPTIAAAMGLSKVYVWQLRNGKRDKIDSAAARKIEKNMQKPIGWLDADPEAWPFPGIDRELFEALTPEQKTEIQGLVRRSILDFRRGEPLHEAVERHHAKSKAA